MSIKQNLVTGSGETFTLDIIYNDVSGTPVDLTGSQARLNVKKAGSGVLVDTYDGVVDADGNIAFNVADEITALWPVGHLAYVAELENPSGDVKWLCYGAFTVISGVDV
jgi:hypothetical protein